MAAAPPFIEMTIESDMEGLLFRFQTILENPIEMISQNMFTLDIVRSDVPTRDTMSATVAAKDFAFLINGPGTDSRGEYLEKSTISLRNRFDDRFDIIFYRMVDGNFPVVYKTQSSEVDDAVTQFHTFISAAQYNDLKEQIDAFVAEHPIYLIGGLLNEPPAMPPLPPPSIVFNNASNSNNWSNYNENSNSNNNAAAPAAPNNAAAPVLNPGTAYHVYDRASPGAHRGYGNFQATQAPEGILEARFEPFTTDDGHIFESQTFSMVAHRFVPMTAVSGGRRRKTQRRPRHRRAKTRRHRTRRH